MKPPSQRRDSSRPEYMKPCKAAAKPRAGQTASVRIPLAALGTERLVRYRAACMERNLSFPAGLATLLNEANG